MKLKLFFASLLVLGSASLMAQMSEEVIPYRYYGYALWEKPVAVETIKKEATVGDFIIPMELVKYNNGSEEINIKDRITITGGNYIDIKNCKHIADSYGNKIKCDYTTYIFKREDISSWFNPAAVYDHYIKDKSGSFVTEYL
ncbi:MAG: hypothetical protein WCQ47_00885 [bacterium]